jgi:uncharacterized coiled-coil DUF342 family protein
VERDSELFALRDRAEAMERKSLEYIETIAHLQYSVSNLKHLLERAEEQIRGYRQAERERQALDLREVGE